MPQLACLIVFFLLFLVLKKFTHLVPFIKRYLQTFMAVVKRTGAGTNPRIPLVVSKSDSI